MRSRRLDTQAILESVAEHVGRGAEAPRRTHWTSGAAVSPLTFEGVEVRPGELLALGGDDRGTWLSWTKDDAELLTLDLGTLSHDQVLELLLAIAGRSFDVQRGGVFVHVGRSRHWVGHEVVLQRHGVLG